MLNKVAMCLYSKVTVGAASLLRGNLIEHSILMLDKSYGFVTVSASTRQSTFLPLIQYLALCLCILGREMTLIFVHFAASDAVISAEPYKICFT